jgi:hypothetical protein
MSSSPPPNHPSGFNQYNNNIQNYNLTSSPSYAEDLNLQLQNLDSAMPQSLNVPIHDNNYTTDDVQFVNTNNISDNSIVFDEKQQQHQQQQISRDHDNSKLQSSNQHTHMNENIIMTPHQYHDIHESEFEDFIPISNNLDPNLQFPSSNSYVHIDTLSNSTTTSSFNSAYFQNSNSTNSISSNLHQTPLQPSRRLSMTINSPLKSNLVTPRVIGPNGTVYAHKRSKSKLSLEKSPATGNPFYNPPSFLSPKINKKSHRKNISISNSISLTHLDTDLQLQQIHQITRSGSPNETPLRTPGRRLNSSYLYGHSVEHNREDEENDDYQEEDDDEEEGEDDDDDDDDSNDKIDSTLENTFTGKSGRSSNLNRKDDSNNQILSNDNTFIVPEIITRNKFGDKLVQISDDLNRALNDNDPLLDSISNNYVGMNYLDEIFSADPNADSLSNDIFSFPSASRDLTDSYYNNMEQLAQQKPKYHYNKSPVKSSNLLGSSNLNNYSKSISVPQTRMGSIVDSKIQRSRSSYNLSDIASLRESKLPLHPVNQPSSASSASSSSSLSYKYQKNSMIPTTEVSGIKPASQYTSNYNDNNLPYETTENNPMRTTTTTTTTTKITSATSGGNKFTSLDEVAKKNSLSIISSQSSSNETMLPRSSSSKKVTDSLITTSMKTRSKSRRSTFGLGDIKHPEKLDLPQQSARSKSRSKKTVNDNKKIHECPLCHMKFQRPEHVKRHMLSHSSEKPFACPEPDCNKRFNRNDNLKQHLRNIHKKKI